MGISLVNAMGTVLWEEFDMLIHGLMEVCSVLTHPHLLPTNNRYNCIRVVPNENGSTGRVWRKN